MGTRTILKDVLKNNPDRTRFLPCSVFFAVYLIHPTDGPILLKTLLLLNVFPNAPIGLEILFLSP